MQNDQVKCWVYYVAGADLIKIGIATSPPKRMADLAAGSPVPLQMLAAHPGGRAEERDLHRRFDSCRAHNEWFKRTPELEAHIAEISRKHGPMLWSSAPAVVEKRQRWLERANSVLAETFHTEPSTPRARRYEVMGLGRLIDLDATDDDIRDAMTVHMENMIQELVAEGLRPLHIRAESCPDKRAVPRWRLVANVSVARLT